MILAIILALLVVYTLASYVDRLYAEMGRFLAREFQENIDAWESRIEPRLTLPPRLVQLCAAVLTQLSFAAILILLARPLFTSASLTRHQTLADLAQASLAVILIVVFCNRLLPFVFFTRTRGIWVARWRLFLQVFFYVVLPIALLVQFLQSIAALAEPATESRTEEDESEAVEALIEAGEEEGILEEGDRELVRSALEFGDKVAREVMTPRPEVFAVPGSLTLEQFTGMLQAKPFSRVPVYERTLDQITGIIFAHDLLQITDADARTRTVAGLQRPAKFVPETKKVNELLREMQHEKQHMSIVIDEYGGVAGLVTIEDLLEEIVGSIADEHETSDESLKVVHEPGGSLIVPGSLELPELEDLMQKQVEFPQDVDATTVAGLVSELAGRIPMAGEVVEQQGLRFEVLASTDRRIERLRISRPTPATL